MKWILYLLILIAILLAANLMLTNCDKQTTLAVNVVTDTVYVEKIKLVEVKVPIPPDRLLIQLKVDSLLRKQKEKEVIVIGQNLSRQKDSKYLHIQTIDSVGKIQMSEYRLLDGDLYVMDSQGNVEIDKENRKQLQRNLKRKRVWQAVKAGVLFTGGVIIGSQLAK